MYKGFSSRRLCSGYLKTYDGEKKSPVRSVKTGQGEWWLFDDEHFVEVCDAQHFHNVVIDAGKGDSLAVGEGSLAQADEKPQAGAGDVIQFGAIDGDGLVGEGFEFSHLGLDFLCCEGVETAAQNGGDGFGGLVDSDFHCGYCFWSLLMFLRVFWRAAGKLAN